MKAVNDFTFTLKIRAVTALLSVEFSFKNFFACFIPSVMMMKMRFMSEKRFVLIEKRLANGLQMELGNLINGDKRSCKWGNRGVDLEY